MMFPPLVRMGCPPIIGRQGKRFAILTESGWHMAAWHPGRGQWCFPDFVNPDAYHAVADAQIRCWMPQDGT